MAQGRRDTTPGRGTARRRPPARVASAATAVLATCVAALTACTEARPDTPSPTPTPTPVLQGEARLPDGPAAVLPGADDVTLALSASAAFYASSPVAVLAPSLDPEAQLRAASVAVALGAPLLLEPLPEPAPLEGADPAPADPAPADPAPADGAAPPPTPAAPSVADVAAELERLGAVAVVTVGAVGQDLPGDVAAVPAPADRRDLAVLVGRDLPASPVTADDAGTGDVAAVAALDRDAPALLTTDATPADEPASEPTATDEPTDEPTGEPVAKAATSTPSPTASAPALPVTELPDAPDGGLVLTTGDPAEVAAVATARAAGVDVLAVPSADPRRDPAVVQAVAASGAETFVGVGDVFGSAEDLAWKAATAATGVELPGGGQILFAGPATGRRMVAMYGSPNIPALGILGEQDVAASIARAQGLAAEYQALTTDVVVPAFEIIATIADRPAGADGNYSNELPAESFVPWVEAALEAGVYVVLDLQPGRTDFVTQARLYESLLMYPNVGLALDPEWRLGPDQVHLRQIGSVSVDEVNAVGDYLAELTRTNHLPQKLLIVHQFMQRMVAGRERLDTTDPAIQVLIHVDGQGSQGAKAGTWANILQGAPANVVWGWKNFIDEDVPMATPQQTYQVQPQPHFVSYQ